jgi:hypothetical protein
MLRRSRQEGVDLYTEIEGVHRRLVCSIRAVLDQDKPSMISMSRAFCAHIPILGAPKTRVLRRIDVRGEMGS